jgi:branched-subunit amino acid ABC-type transport system permease component
MLLAMAICRVGRNIERFAYRPVLPRLTALITAIGVSLLLERWVPVPTQSSFPNCSANAMLIFCRRQHPYCRPSLIIAFGLMIALQLVVFVLRRTSNAVSFNLNSAKLMGINTDRIILALGCTGGSRGAGGNPNPARDLGILVGLKAFVAAVLGGIIRGDAGGC